MDLVKESLLEMALDEAKDNQMSMDLVKESLLEMPMD